jgi:hypothetical protein
LDLISPAAPPRLNSNCHRCFANSQNAGVKTDFIPDKDWFMKYHAINGYSDTAPARATDCSVSPGKIHLRH